ncbi:MAG: hypothetical protein V4724_14185 [Pseudomonadota bacterium]
MPMIAKYQDIAHGVQMASRYVAFEAMIRNDAQSTWKSEAQLAGEVRRRFFSNSDAAIKTNDVAGDFTAHQNPFWRTPDDKPLIAKFDPDVSLSFGPDSRPTHADAFTAADDGTPFNKIAGVVPFKVAEEIGVKSRGIYTANVTVKLANLPAGLKSYESFDAIDLSMTRHTSLVIDGWGAKDPEMVESRIDKTLLVPAKELRRIKPVVNPAITIFEMLEIPGSKLGELDFWRDVVPADRLKNPNSR